MVHHCAVDNNFKSITQILRTAPAKNYDLDTSFGYMYTDLELGDIN